MIVALLPLMLQAAPAEPVGAPADAENEIVVRAKVGRVALVFDKGTDGRLHNCRVLISSGVQRIDDKACQDLPDCITANSGKRFCGDTLAAVPAIEPKKAKPAPIAKIDLSDLAKPEPVSNPAIGPAAQTAASDTPDQIVKLPPLPKDETHEPAIRISGNASD
ncbi:hypothetical protein [Stakelama marina]|uniref:TonB C-terminal domain-containing protein n=1 Tax=Stakelama marina TaxID=2826939 RepID=A0A8T4IK92_9SPHN|nr:hypothetical protein [Stakelama marina]MBR0552606.1 hypothetical protein [Stakelama marina]